MVPHPPSHQVRRAGGDAGPGSRPFEVGGPHWAVIVLFDAPPPPIIFLLSALSHCKTLLPFQTVGETSRWFCCLKPEVVLTKYVTSFKSKSFRGGVY